MAWVKPLTDVPVIDDWVYAWSVEHLLKTGRLRVLEFSSVYPLAQILWGALFARVAGFSFGVLRLSTVVLAVLGCWALYLTLRERTAAGDRAAVPPEPSLTPSSLARA